MSTPLANAIADRHREVALLLPGAALPWLKRRRTDALERFAGAGLPTQRQEIWKYTPLHALSAAELDWAGTLPGEPVIDRLPTISQSTSSHRLVLVNGRFRADLSTIGTLPKGVVLGGLAEVLATAPTLAESLLGKLAPADPLVDLNDAFLADGLLLHVPRGTAVDAPIELVLINQGRSQAWHPRVAISLEDNAAASVVEHHVGPVTSNCVSNLVAEIEIGAGARLRHARIQREGSEAFHLANIAVRLGRDAALSQFTFSVGARLARTQSSVTLGGKGATAHVSAAYAARGNQHTDFTSRIEHAEPHGISRQIVHGVLDDHARAVFQGKIVVQPGAQKSDGHQLNRALLLSDAAEIDSKPELEIWADDVKCSHGATTGALDESALFYLRSRGVPHEEARGLLVGAFLAEALEEIADSDARAFARDLAETWLGWRP